MIKIIGGILGILFLIGFGFSEMKDTESEVSYSQDSLGQFVKEIEYGADLYMGSHNEIDELLDVIKKKYKGKPVILDLWGTFCKPCISDFKNSPKVKKELMSELDVHVVYLCAGMSSNISQWEKVISENTLIGDHVYLDRKLTMAYREKFDIKRYPNYILLDKDGNFKNRFISAIGDLTVDRLQEYL